MTPASNQAIVAVGGAVVVGIALVGFLSGTAPDDYDLHNPLHAVHQPAPTGPVPEARPYLSMRDRATTTATLPASLAALEGTGAATDATLEEALAARSARRAYHGAPPVIPHPVRQRSAAECLACHDDGLAFGALRAAGIPHDAFTSCTQCHAMAEPDLPWGERSEGLDADPRAVDNTFVGTEAPQGGGQWTPLAPPVIPHDTFLHERCQSCHGPDGRDPMQTPHPDRQSCEQCHAHSADLEQRPGGR